jgi:hypothetical protein
VEPADTIRELMQAFDTYRAKWIEMFGSDQGFSEWFTQQVNGTTSRARTTASNTPTAAKPVTKGRRRRTDHGLVRPYPHDR